MGTKVKKKKGIVALLGKEEQDVRYDIIKHSLWIMVRCLFVLNAVWYGILLLHEYGSFQKTLAEILAAPAMLLAVAFLFERCAEHFNLPLYDGVVLLCGTGSACRRPLVAQPFVSVCPASDFLHDFKRHPACLPADSGIDSHDIC